MHLLQLALLVVTSSSALVVAHSPAFQLRQRSSIPFKHGNSDMLFKRQDSGAGDDGFPASCMAACQPYIDTGVKCTGLEEGGSEQYSNVSQADIHKCACTSEFFAATVACIACAPETFSDSSGTTPRQLIGSAQAQCRALGIETTVDFSPLDNTGAGDSSSNSGERESDIETGTTPVDDAEQEEEGNTDTGVASKTSLEEAPAPSSSEAPLVEEEQETTRVASFTPAKPTTPVAASPSPSSNGAGVALKSQLALASIVAAGLGTAYLLV